MDTAVGGEGRRATRLALPAIDITTLFARYGELAFVVALTAFAAAIRFWDLTELPYGFHNDEGNVALDAKRILEEGWIGPWSLLATGYPIAVNYYVAPFIEIFGFGVLGVRFPMALLGTLTIPLAYYTFRVAAGWRVAVCGSILLAVSIIHLHLSRIGFPVIAWPALELGAVLCLTLGIRTRAWPYFIIAGALIGVGIWAYNSVFLFAMAVAIYLSLWMLWQIIRHPNMRTAQYFMLLLILLGSTVLAAWPIYEYQQDDPGYRNGFRGRYIFNRPEYEFADTRLERAEVIKDKSYDLYRYFTTESHADGADGLGIKPPYGKALFYLAFVGMAVALFRLGNPMMGIGLLAVPLVALGAVLTIDGQFRRTFGIVPFVVFFAGLTLGLAWEWADRQRLAVRVAVVALIAATIGTMGYQNLKFYFRDMPDSQTTRFVFFPEMRQGAEYVATLGHPYLYMYSERATVGHESRRVLADNIAGAEDRGEEWTREPPRFDLQPQQTPAIPPTVQPDGAVFLFMSKYGQTTEYLQQVMDRYPGGEVSERFDEQYQVWNYRAYYLPADLLDLYSRQESVAYPVVPQPN